MLILPFINYPDFSETVTLDGIAYRFRFRWNYRGQFWAMDISDIEENSLLSGLKIVVNWDLFSRHAGRGLPPGQLYATAENGSEDRIETNDIPDRVKLIYIEENELSTL